MSVDTIETVAADEATPAPAVKAPKAPTKCQCTLYAVEVEQNGELVLETIDCEEVTASKFAPGHDAKLKSMLIRAGSEGLRVFKTVRAADGSEEDVEYGHEAAADDYGFGDKVRSGVALARQRAEEKAVKAAARAEKSAQLAAEREAKKAERKATVEAAKAARAEAAAAKKQEREAARAAKAEERARLAAEKKAEREAAKAAKAAASNSDVAEGDTPAAASADEAELF